VGERDEIVEELKHLVRYYQQAVHEFFDETSGETVERLEALYNCIEKNENSLEEYRKMIDFLLSTQDALKQRVDDLGYLTVKMKKLFETPS
jgi:uncharacterized protein (UPF0297 family)